MIINLDVIKPLSEKEIQFSDWFIEKHSDKIPVVKRVLFYDPTPLYEKVAHKIEPTKRHQSIQMEDIFPKTNNGICACGCGVGTKKHSETYFSKWATQQCNQFANDVLSIMNNYFGKPAYYISLYYGKICCECLDPIACDLELDHIIGVKHGGGACWLSNYQWRCKACHNKKTNKDFGRKEFNKSGKDQLKLL